MSEFFIEYGLFLLKTGTLVIAFVLVASIVSQKKVNKSEGLEVENLNDKYQDMARKLKKAFMQKKEWKSDLKQQKIKKKADLKTKKTKSKTFVIDFIGDLRASASASLREEVSAILEVADDDDEVIVRLDNHGGVVHEHGLAASQLIRIRKRGINLSVCVDKVAASGGYLMACVANKIYAAPFAILGSIGVIAQLPNFNRLLDTHGVDFEEITAGKFKRDVTMFGKNTDADRAKLKEQLEEVHELFKSSITEYRSSLDINKVSNGEYWHGTRALELGLADEIKTSDELLTERSKDRDIFRVSYKFKKSFQKKFLASIDGVIVKFTDVRWKKWFESRLPR